MDPEPFQSLGRVTTGRHTARVRIPAIHSSCKHPWGMPTGTRSDMIVCHSNVMAFSREGRRTPVCCNHPNRMLVCSSNCVCWWYHHEKRFSSPVGIGSCKGNMGFVRLYAAAAQVFLKQTSKSTGCSSLATVLLSKLLNDCQDRHILWWNSELLPDIPNTHAVSATQGKWGHILELA